MEKTAASQTTIVEKTTPSVSDRFKNGLNSLASWGGFTAAGDVLVKWLFAQDSFVKRANKFFHKPLIQHNANPQYGEAVWSGLVIGAIAGLGSFIFKKKSIVIQQIQLPCDKPVKDADKREPFTQKLLEERQIAAITARQK